MADSSTNSNTADNADDEDDDVETRLLLEASESLLMGTGGDGDDEDEDFNFISEEQRAEQAAERRRLERKRKRQRIMILEQQNSSRDQVETTGGGGSPPLPPPPSRPQKLEATVTATSNKDNDVEEENQGNDDDDDDDMFDMFSSSVSPPNPKTGLGDSDDKNSSTAKNTRTVATIGNKKNGGGGGGGDHNQRDFDDSEGYYKATIGEMIPLVSAIEQSGGEGNGEKRNGQEDITVRVQGIIGKGVFSSVLKCSVTTAPGYSSSSAIEIPLQVEQEVALKCIRANETMTKSAMNEINFLRRLSNCTGIVQLLLPTSTNTTIDHNGHTILVFPYEPFNLRDVLIKFGKGVGLSLMAVKNFFGQLLAAATHLVRHKILHADIKPDNLLVSESYSRILIADFGSAMDLSDPNNTEIITPYLASRFYRAPEIMLGLPPTYSIDLWSLAVTAAEIFLGNVLFQGTTNNDMLYKMMSSLGPMPNRIIRRHLLQAQKNPIPTHFDQIQTNYFFRRESVDPVLGQAVHKEISMTDTEIFKSNALQSKLLKARSPKDSRKQVLLFSDLLSKCLSMDPNKRITCKEALRHDFFATNTTLNQE